MNKIKDNEKRLFSNTIMLYLMKFSTMLFPLITLPYLTRVLGAQMYGLYTFVNSYTAYFVLFIDFGFILSATKDIAANANDKDKVQTIFSSVILAKLMFGFLSMGIAVGISYFIPAIRNHQVYVALSLFAIILSAFLPDFLFRGIEKMGAVTMRYVITKSIFTIMLFFVVKEPAHIYRVPILTMIGEAVAVILSWVYIYKKLHYKFIFPKFSEILNQIKISAVYFYSRISSTVYANTNTFILGLYNPIGSVGLYGVANSITTSIKSLYGPLSDSLYPYMIRNKNFKLIYKSLLIFMPIVLIGSVVLAIWAPLFIRIVSGEGYEGATTVLRCLIPTLVFSLPSYILGFPTMGPLGLNKQANLSVVYSSVFHGLGLILLMAFKNVTLEAVAILTSCTEAIVLLIRLAYLINYKKTGRSWFVIGKSKEASLKNKSQQGGLKMKAVILAAGLGSRLAPITNEVPKCMVEVNGIKIVEQQINNLIKAGICPENIVVLTGYKAEILESFLQNKFPGVNWIRNDLYNKTNNMYSMYMTKPFVVGQNFLLMNGDVFFAPEIIAKLLADPREDLIVCDDGIYIEESMKIRKAGERIVEISKKISPQDAYGVSIDVYKFSAEASAMFFETMRQYIEVRQDLNSWTEVALNTLLQTKEFQSLDMKDLWVEIDNHDDLKEAESKFKA